MPPFDADEFVLNNTRPASPPLVPELTLRLASEVVPLWTKTEDLRSGALPPPYWAFAWPGGQALARYILDHPGEFSGRSALDFGAGSGLVAIAAAKTGAKITAADIDPLSIAAMKHNAAANGVSIGIDSSDLIGTELRWEIMLIGDMCYERPLAERLLPWLRRAVTRQRRVLVGDPGRNYFPNGGLEKLATYAVPTTRDLEDREMRETSVYRLLAG
jgi:predicted nicotinamide N-methyase